MSVMKLFTLSLTLALSACATCQHHPTVCTAVVTITATSLALSARHSAPDGHSTTQPLPCGSIACIQVK